jgi:hypothetical protein
MTTFRSALALLLLLGVARVVHANVSLPIYKSDPHYERAQVASRVAPFAVVGALVFAVLWAACSRSKAGRILAVAFGASALLWCLLLRLGGPGTRFPDEELGRENAVSLPRVFGRRAPGSPRPITPEETTIIGILFFAGMCVGGLALVRLMARRGGGKGEGPDQALGEGGP